MLVQEALNEANKGYVPQKIGLNNQEIKQAKNMFLEGKSDEDIAMHFSVPVDVILEFRINNWYITGIDLPADHEWITADEHRANTEGKGKK